MTPLNKKVTCIGAGNMAEALVSGWIGKGVLASEQIVVSDVSNARLDLFKNRYGVTGMSDNQKAIGGADVVLLAVKPQVMMEVLAPLEDGGQLWISIAAGLSLGKLEKALDSSARVIRVMPNTPALVGAGVSGLTGGSRVTEADMKIAVSLLQAVGLVVSIEESKMDALTAVSGSGPAYVFYLAEMMIRAAVEMGLEEEQAEQLVGSTIHGASRLLIESDESASALRAKVASPGGTTEAALGLLNEEGVADSLNRALKAARDRSRELSS